MSASSIAPIIHSINEPAADYVPWLLVSGVPELDNEVAWLQLRQPTFRDVDKLQVQANQLRRTEFGPVVRIEIIFNKRPNERHWFSKFTRKKEVEDQRRSGIFMLAADYLLPFAYITGSDNELITPYLLRALGIPTGIVKEVMKAAANPPYAIVISRQKTMIAGDIEVGIAGFQDEWRWWKFR